MVKLFVFLLSSFVVVFAQTWVDRARVKDHIPYFKAVMQETIYGMEEVGWCNLKLTDVHLNVSEQMYKWSVNGKVHYFNGFLVTMQKIDLTAISQDVSSTTINSERVPVATVSGRMILRHPKLGYDGVADIVDVGIQRFTGEITLPAITWTISITKNWSTKAMSVSLNSNTGGGIIRMVYIPATNVTEVLSRRFLPVTTGEGVRSWTSVIEPILTKVVNKTPFPDLCFSNC